MSWPEERILIAKKSKWLIDAVTASLFVAFNIACFFVLSDLVFVRVLTGGLSVLGFVFLAFCLMMLIRLPTLELGINGFKERLPWRSRYFHWTEVSEFETLMVSGSDTHSAVVFSASNLQIGKLEAWLSRAVGNKTGLHDTYGLRVRDLASLMNDYRKNSLNAAAKDV